MSTGPAVSVFREKSFYRETWCTRRRDRHVAKYSSDPRQSYPEVKLQGRVLVRVVGIFAPFAPMRVRYPGKTCTGVSSECHVEVLHVTIRISRTVVHRACRGLDVCSTDIQYTESIKIQKQKTNMYKKLY